MKTDERQNAGQPTFKIPGPIAVALMTGRPEMASIGVMSMAKDLMPEHIEQFALYVENVVREIQAEREIQRIVSDAVHNAVTNLRGALRAMERLDDAMRTMANNGSADEIRCALNNPLRKDGE